MPSSTPNMEKLTVETFILGPMETNCYLLTRGSDAVLIDCPPEPERLGEAISEKGINLEAIYLTHMHLDHIGGVGQISRQTGADVFASKSDSYLNEVSFKYGGAKEFRQYADFDFKDIKPGKYNVLRQPMMVLDTPGHTPGSLSYLFPAAGCVFTGDLIFMISVGRTDFPGGDSKALLNSIRNRIFILPDDTRIYSGHGPMSTVAFEKKNNPLFFEENT